MRIPGINQTGVPGAEQLSLGAISSAVQAKMQTTSALTRVVDDYQTKVVKAETDEEYSRLSNGFARDTGAAWDGIKNQARIDENGDPTYKQMMGQYEIAHNKLAKEYSGRVTINSNKGAFSRYADSTLTNNTNAVRGEEGRRAVEHLTGSYTQSKIDLMGNPDGIAMFAELQSGALSTGLINDSQRANDFDAFQHEHETNTLMSNFQTSRDAGLDAKEGQTYLENLEFPASFDDGEKQRVLDQMGIMLRSDQVKVDAKARTEASAVKAEQKVITDEAKRHQKIITSGAILADGFVDSYTDLIGKISDPIERRDLSNSLRWYADGQSLLHGENHSLDDLIEAHGTLSATAVTDVTEGERRDVLVNMIDGAISSINQDPQQAAVTMGLLKPQQSTLRDAIGSGDIEAYLKEQSLRKALIDEHWGINTSLFKDDEIDALSDHLNAPKGYKTLESLVKTMDGGSHELLAKIFTKGYRTLAVVGDLMSQEDAGSAVELVHNGKKLADGEGGLGFYGPEKDSAKLNFDDYIGDGSKDLFEGDHEIKQGMQDAVKFAYAGLSMRAKDNSGDFDEDRYEAALNAVVGNVYERGDYMFVTPRREMKEYHVKKWLNRLDEADFSSIDPDLDWEQVKKEVISGDIDLVPIGEQGRYMMSRNGMFLKDGNTQDFILEYKE